MGNPWFRMYAEFANDPKVQMMTEVMQRRLVMLMCMRCGNDMETFHETEIAFQLRVSESDLAETKLLFIAKGFIDEHWNLINWDKRQFSSDSSTSRVQKFREKQRNVAETFPKRPRTEQIQNRTEESDDITPEMVSQGVRHELAVSTRDLAVSLDEICRAEMKQGRDPSELRNALIAAYREYDLAKPKLSYTKGAAKFFGEGDWRNKEGWPWKEGQQPAAARKRVYIA